jgi:rhamnosyltransferase subunit B
MSAVTAGPVCTAQRHSAFEGSLSDLRNASPEATPLVIVSTTGTGGDIQPFVILAQGLRERGHRVVLLVPAFQEAAAKASGLPYETFGTHEEFLAALNNPDLWDERKGWGVVWKGLVPHLDVLRTLVQRLPTQQPCVVLSHPIMVPLAALARSERPELHIVAAYLAPSNLCSSHGLLTMGSLQIAPWVPLLWRQMLWRMVNRFSIDPMTLPSLNAARAKHKMSKLPHFFDHMLKAPNESLSLFPDWFASEQPDWPHPFTAGSFLNLPRKTTGTGFLPPELERFLSGGDPPIVFTPGTGHQHAASYFSTALEVLKGLGWRGLFLTPHEAQVPHPLPAHILWLPHVPFDTLLPRAAALVHHGGIGTMAEAFRAGVPQLVVPFAYDQFDNGQRANHLGVADVLLAKRLTVKRLHKQLVRLLSSHTVAQACLGVAKKMGLSPDNHQILDRIEAALGTGSVAGASQTADDPSGLPHPVADAVTLVT